MIIKYLTISSEQCEIDAKFQTTLHFERKTNNKYMKNKNFRKLKYVSGNPQNAEFCTIYPTASRGLGGPQTPGLNFSASFRSPFSTYFFKKASYFWKC